MAAAINSEASMSSRPKLACLCSPTNHPGSFRCIRHRPIPRARHLSSSSSPPPPPPSSSPSSGGVASAGARAKGGRSVRAHLLRMISCSNGGRRRRRGDFQPRPSRLRQCAS
ncbi:uncharacterized protein [Oryza sativa Japonica Group]|uniref:Os02g0799600 protein n=4 Tax=Oryza TaxID=4527 RepID=Q0DWR4_ORYSJ|nr:hypothetical protein OsI_09308 [Oryza sativa Indica Group]EEE57988.1 hypothetical protein OsJ_08743 [Oryza sativa Japonica Group]KAB8089348.1 hypothetical protein EE612_014264 [Oryza sativa]BAD36065.1 unknown protein [Oryza sativa Japonica Group]BAF10324.1 Os02g0799600 [Oryza sativa Japonica Group]|eukprot:NP_001048410.1 Os02g0799600 [Oryza sativa Japonica Group]